MVDYAHVVRSDILSHFTCVRFLALFFSVPSADTQGRCKFSLRNVPFSHFVVVLLLQHCCASDFSDFFCCCFCWKGTVRRMKRNPSIHLFGTWSNVLVDSNEIEREKLNAHFNRKRCAFVQHTATSLTILNRPSRKWNKFKIHGTYY